MRKIDAVRRYPEDMTPEQMIEFEAREQMKVLNGTDATVQQLTKKLEHFRENAEDEDNRLEATKAHLKHKTDIAKFILGKILPDKVSGELSGGLTIIVERKIVGANEKDST